MLNIPSDSITILKVSELKEQLIGEGKNVDMFDEQLPTNLALVYYLKSGKVILLPNDCKDESMGILFENKEYYQSCLLKDRFPIDNPNMTIYEKLQPEILDIKNGIDKILNHLDTLANNKSTNNSFDLIAINDILGKIKKDQHKISLKEKLYAAIALGEYIRRKNNGNWILLKQYGTYNAYFKPAILYPDSTILDILNFFDTYYENKKITVEAFVDLPYIKNPTLKLEYMKYKKFPNPYIIL